VEDLLDERGDGVLAFGGGRRRRGRGRRSHRGTVEQKSVINIKQLKSNRNQLHY